MLRLVRNDQDRSEMIRTVQDWGGMTRINQDWLGIIWKLLDVAELFKIGSRNLDSV